MIEQLEDRLLLTSTLNKNILQVTGTEGADTVVMVSSQDQEIRPNGNIEIVHRIKIMLNGSLDGNFIVDQVKRTEVRLLGGDDRFTASQRLYMPFTVHGDDGNDTISGAKRNDSIFGGNGDDVLTGGLGGDYIASEAGADTIVAGGGFDTVDFSARASGMTIALDGLANDGEAGAQTGNIHGDLENLIGSRGADNISASGLTTNVSIFGNNGNDTLRGGDGDDTLTGGKGNDSIRGGSGDDFITGGAGRDRLFGDNGSDVLDGSGDNIADTLDGGNGSDLGIYDFRDRLRHL